LFRAAKAGHILAPTFPIVRSPPAKIKIDRSFIHEIASDSDDKAIAEAIIAFGRALDLTDGGGGRRDRRAGGIAARASL
jgi:hypothetical protein